MYYVAMMTSILAVIAPAARAALVIDFEELTLSPESFYNGDQGIGSNSNGWTSRGVFFNNTFTDGGSYTFWNGWSYSNVTDNTTPGYANQYSAFPGGGASGNGSASRGTNYAIAYDSGSLINIPAGFVLQSLEMANTTYTALSMANGDGFSKKFGGVSGNDPDFFRVTLTGYDAANGAGNVVDQRIVDLADYTSSDNSRDFILADWSAVDLTSFVGVRSITLKFDSTDQGTFGINTPTYVALDNLRFSAVPEPTGFALLASAGLLLMFRRVDRRG